METFVRGSTETSIWRSMRLFVLIVSLFMLTGCGMLHLPGLTTPDRPKTVYGWNEKETKTPVVGVLKENGDQVITYETKKELTVNLEEAPVQLTFMQRLGRAIGSLSIWVLIAILVGVLGFPTVTIPWLMAQVGKYKKALTQTVKAIDQGPAEAKTALKPMLSDKQDTDTKAIIGEIKAKI